MAKLRILSLVAPYVGTVYFLLCCAFIKLSFFHYKRATAVNKVAVLFQFFVPTLASIFAIFFCLFLVLNSTNDSEMVLDTWEGTFFDLWSSYSVLWMSLFSMALLRATHAKSVYRVKKSDEVIKEKIKQLVLTFVFVYLPMAIVRLTSSPLTSSYVNLSYTCVLGGSAGVWSSTMLSDVIRTAEAAAPGTGVRYKPLKYLAFAMIGCAIGCYMLAQACISFFPTSELLRDIFVITCLFCGSMMFSLWFGFEYTKSRNILKKERESSRLSQHSGHTSTRSRSTSQQHHQVIKRTFLTNPSSSGLLKKSPFNNSRSLPRTSSPAPGYPGWVTTHISSARVSPGPDAHRARASVSTFGNTLELPTEKQPVQAPVVEDIIRVDSKVEMVTTMDDSGNVNTVETTTVMYHSSTSLKNRKLSTDDLDETKHPLGILRSASNSDLTDLADQV